MVWLRTCGLWVSEILSHYWPLVNLFIYCLFITEKITFNYLYRITFINIAIVKANLTGFLSIKLKFYLVGYLLIRHSIGGKIAVKAVSFLHVLIRVFGWKIPSLENKSNDRLSLWIILNGKLDIRANSLNRTLLSKDF